MRLEDLASGSIQETPRPTPLPIPTQELTTESLVASSTAITPRGTTGYSRKLPWGTGRILGATQGAEQFNSARQAMMALGLDWEVEKTDLFTEFNGGRWKVDDFQAVRRSDNGNTLGIVKGQYAPWQNRRLAEFTDTLVSVSGTRTATMGEAFGGRKVYSVVELPDIDAPDGAIGTFIIVSNSHDGSSSVSASFMIVRWSCTNGMVALWEEPHTIKVRHTGTMEHRLQEAQRIMAAHVDVVEDTTYNVERMLAVPVMATQAERFINEIIPIPDETKDNQRAVRNAMKRQQEVRSTWLNSENLEDIRHTGYGFFNAVVEWNEWTGSHVNRRRLSPMERLLNDSASDAVAKARELVLA